MSCKKAIGVAENMKEIFGKKLEVNIFTKGCCNVVKFENDKGFSSHKMACFWLFFVLRVVIQPADFIFC